MPRASSKMPDVKNPRVHAEILPALAAVVAPTTKILAIGSVTAKGTSEAIASVRPHEVRATVRNHLAGKDRAVVLPDREPRRRLHREDHQHGRGARTPGEASPRRRRNDGIRADRSRAACAARHAHRRTSAFVMRPAGLVVTLVALQALSPTDRSRLGMVKRRRANQRLHQQPAKKDPSRCLLSKP